LPGKTKPKKRLLRLALFVLYKQITDTPPQAFFHHRAGIGKILLTAHRLSFPWMRFGRLS
jgi:hypothetical protein